MSKIKFIIATAVLLGMAFVFQSMPEQYEHVLIETKLPEYKDGSEVADASELIVEVVKLKEEPLSYPLENDLSIDYTLAYVEVQEVIKSSDGIDVEIGDVINVIENEWVDEKEKKVYHRAGYSKMKTKKGYTLYLGYNKEVDNYYIIGSIYGKVPKEKEEKLFFATDEETMVVEGIVKELQNR